MLECMPIFKIAPNLLESPLNTLEDIEHLETLKVIEVPHLCYSVGYRLSGNCVDFFNVFFIWTLLFLACG